MEEFLMETRKKSLKEFKFREESIPEAKREESIPEAILEQIHRSIPGTNP